jgi:excisionase family DNA binding protein
MLASIGGRMTNERYLTVPEAAEQLRVGVPTIRRWLREGKIGGTMIGGTKSGYRIPESEVRRLLAGDGTGKQS